MKRLQTDYVQHMNIWIVSPFLNPWSVQQQHSHQLTQFCFLITTSGTVFIFRLCHRFLKKKNVIFFHLLSVCSACLALKCVQTYRTCLLLVLSIPRRFEARDFTCEVHWSRHGADFRRSRDLVSWRILRFVQKRTLQTEQVLQVLSKLPKLAKDRFTSLHHSH